MATTRNRPEIKTQQLCDIGNYHLLVPGNGVQPFFIEDPNIRIQKWGGVSYTNMIDIDSSLKGIDKQLKCDVLQKSNLHTNPISYPSTNLLYTENSRLISPAWNLKGIEVVKSDYLHYDPRIKSSIPFRHNVSSRDLQKDNYSPIYANNFQNLSF
uniref:Uncharacterized protein n=1 Tax=viral metagenome TaxID=1070528 RepID=A0A6C0HQS8_9ZZZZ